MAEPDEPSTDFVEFVRIWGSTLSGTLQLCPEAIISYESRGREFTVQVGHEVGDVRNHNGRNLGIITSAGNMLILQRRKRGVIQHRYRIIGGNGHSLTATKTYLPNLNRAR